MLARDRAGSSLVMMKWTGFCCCCCCFGGGGGGDSGSGAGADFLFCFVLIYFCVFSFPSDSHAALRTGRRALAVQLFVARKLAS